MKKISPKAILAGCLVNYLLRTLLTAIPIIYALRDILWHDLTFWQLAKTLIAAPDEYLKLYYFQVFVDPLSALIAGYIAARLARGNELINSALALLPAVIFSIFHRTSDTSTQLSGMEILLIAATISCALLGGFIRAAQVNAAVRASQR